MSVLAAGIILAQLAGAAPPAGDAPVLTLADRTELRARSRLTTGGVAEDIENTPLATLVARGRRTDASLGYALHLGYLDFFENPTFIVSHAGQLTLGYLASRELRLYAAADGYVGKQFTEGLVAPTKLGTTPLPTATAFAPTVPVIDSAAYRAEVGFGYRLDRRWDFAGSAMYGGGQGLDEVSRLAVPRYYGPSGTVSVAYEVTKADRLATGLRAAYTLTPKFGASYFNTAVSETWTHTFSPRTTGIVGAGVAWQRTHDRTGANARSSLFPDAQLGLTHRIPLGAAETLSFEATGRTGFTYDAVLRTSSPQASAGAGAGWARAEVGANARFDYLTTLPSSSTQPVANQASGTTGQVSGTASQISGSALMWYAPAPAVRFEAGFRAYRQDLPSGLPLVTATQANTTQAIATQTNTVQWAAFVAVVLTAPPVQL